MQLTCEGVLHRASFDGRAFAALGHCHFEGIPHRRCGWGGAVLRDIIIAHGCYVNPADGRILLAMRNQRPLSVLRIHPLSSPIAPIGPSRAPHSPTARQQGGKMTNKLKYKD